MQKLLRDPTTRRHPPGSAQGPPAAAPAVGRWAEGSSTRHCPGSLPAPPETIVLHLSRASQCGVRLGLRLQGNGEPTPALCSGEMLPLIFPATCPRATPKVRCSGIYGDGDEACPYRGHISASPHLGVSSTNTKAVVLSS